MTKLVKLQLRNVFHNKLFYICLALAILMSGVFYFLETLSPEGLKVMPQVVSTLNGGLSIIEVIFVALFCCYDFSDGTIKNIVARGYTKKQVLFSKYIVSIISVFAMYLILILVTFIMYIKNGIGYESGMILIIMNSIVGIIVYTIFYSTMSFLLEKNGSAIIACLFVPTIMISILHLLDAKLNIHISKYWIDSISSNFMANQTLNNFILSIMHYLIYIVIFLIVGVQLLKKKEIK